ncbi:hypothetical protein MKX03_029777 [Papaver bracteatum]|nr:hypothetical protein MKX03_029777 [Papaver bracteatum]
MQPPLPPPPPPPSQFSSAPPAPHVVQHGGSMYYHGPPFPPRLAPLPSSHGQMLYSAATQLHPPPPPLPQYGLFSPPPLPSCYVHSSYENPFETVSFPPPSLPPPPPQPSLPHEPTSNVLACSDMLNADGLAISNAGRNAEDGNRCVKGATGEDSEVEGVLSPPPPRKPAEQEIVQRIEVLCRLIAKNGPAFEARVKESGNPKLAFLFGGQPGSEAANAYEYFQWMKSKCCMYLQSGEQPEKTISLPAPLDLDMEMEDEMNQSDKDQRIFDSVEGLKEPGSKSNEVSLVNVKEQSPEHPHLISSTSWNTTSGLLPASEASISAADGIEQQKSVHGRPSSKDDSSAEGGLSGEEASGTLVKSRIPLYKRLQDYASDDFAEDDDGMPFDDVSSVRVSPSVTASITSSREDEMAILYADVGCENISTKEEVFLPSAESGSIQSIGPLSRKPNISLDTTAKFQDNNSLTFKDDIQGDADIGVHSDKLRNTEKCLTSKKVDQYGRLVREDASESDSDGARYTRRRARRYRSQSRSRSRSKSRSPNRRKRRKSRSPGRRKDKRNRSRSWTPKRQRSRNRSPHFRYKKRGNIPNCNDFLRGRCFRGASCRYIHTSTSGDPVKQNKSRSKQYLEPPQDPKNNDINGVSQIVVSDKNPPSQVAHGSIGNSGSLMDHVTSCGTAGVHLSDSEAAIPGVKVVQQAPEEELGVQLKENEICRQPLETLPSEILPVQLTVVSEAEHLTGVVSQNEPSACQNNVQPPQTNIVDVPVQHAQPFSQPFFGHPSNPYPIPTSMSQTQVHQVATTSSSAFHSYAPQLPHPPPFLQDVNVAAYISMPPTANIQGQLASMERLPYYQAPFQGQHSTVPPQPTWMPLPPAPNSAFQNPAFHLQYLQHPMQPGNEFNQPVMRPYSHEAPYNNMSQLPVAGASKMHYNPYASTFEQTPGNTRFGSVLKQDMDPNYRNNNDSLGSSASASGLLPLDSSRSGGQFTENLTLFESVESSSTTFLKLGNTGDRQAVEGASAANMSPGDGEFDDAGIDAEVGAVENGSPHLAEEGNWSLENPADDEIGQVEISGESKKSKDSRLMKHFRVAIADFGREVLKPSWREGNMSKEAFKTIVKKTVDKVSGAVKEHQIPKSQAQINQYVESSQRKLRKLVMGYVDKYVKV